MEDASQGYDYDELKNILNAKVFNGKSMCDVIKRVTWDSLDGVV